MLFVQIKKAWVRTKPFQSKTVSTQEFEMFEDELLSKSKEKSTKKIQKSSKNKKGPAHDKAFPNPSIGAKHE